MATKRQSEDDERRARLLALVGEGGRHYRENLASKPESGETPKEDPPETQAPEPPPPAPEPKSAAVKAKRRPPKPAAEPDRPEEPALGPEPEVDNDPAKWLIKKRRSLRDDPEWIGTTLYLRRETHAALQEFCKGAGMDMSRVVQYCVSLQMNERQRAPALSRLLGGEE